MLFKCKRGAQMKLKDFIRLHKNDEIEVWDEVVDIANPYYVEGDYAFDDEDDMNLRKMEQWIQELEITKIRGTTVMVNVYSKVKEKFTDDDDDIVCDYVEDIFTTLSQGYYGFAKMFCDEFKL